MIIACHSNIIKPKRGQATISNSNAEEMRAGWAAAPAAVFVACRNDASGSCRAALRCIAAQAVTDFSEFEIVAGLWVHSNLLANLRELNGRVEVSGKLIMRSIAKLA